MAELPAAAAAQLAAQLAALGEEFQRSLPARLRQVEAALTALGKHWEDREVRDRSDEAALRKLCAVAHSLAGAAGTFGHPVLGATALAIEELARQLDADPAARVDSARLQFDRLLTTLTVASDSSPPALTAPAAALSGARK